MICKGKILGGSSILEYQLFQSEGVFDGEAIGIIIEIEEYSLPLFSPVLDLPCPLL
jgi:hypothetical protein